jgi:membrane associated rhomboid family serine protease
MWILRNLWLIPSESGFHAYLTTLFVHAGLLHLIGNMIYLFLFGACVEDLIGRGKFVIFYLLGGLASDLAHIIATPGNFSSDLPLGGASGAISACIGGFVLFFHKTKINFRYFIWFLRIWTGEFSLPAWVVITFWFAKDFLSAAFDYVSAASGSGVAFGAHVGGFVSGFAMVAGYKAWCRWNEAEEEKALRSGKSATPGTFVRTEPATLYLFEAGTQLGPFTNAQVAEMLALGSVTREALYWHEATQQWRSVMELPGR